MKKILSVLLALVMMLSTMTLLVNATEPAGSAGTPATNVAAGANSGHIFYSQNFDDPDLADLKNEDLTDALEWEDPLDYQTFSVENGQLRVVADLMNGDTKLTAPYTTKLVKDEQMNANAITIEYKLTYQNKEDATQVNNAAFVSVNLIKDEQNYINATPVTMSASINPGSMIVRKGGAQGILESLIPPEGALDNFVGTQHVIKCVIDPNSDGVQVQVDGNPMTCLNYDQRAKWNNYNMEGGINDVIGDTLQLMIQPGLDVLIDDICVSEYAPALQISEVMANAGTAGNYQWVEVYNPTNAPVNIYDYCVVIYNACTNKAGNVGSEIDNGTTSMQYVTKPDGTVHYMPVHTPGTYDKNGASTIGYFQPGAMEILVNGAELDPAKRYQVFNSPEYDQGVIEPGETAIAFLPYTAAKGNNPVDEKSVREHLTKLGLPEDVSIFACNNKVSKCQCDDKVCTDLSKCTKPYQYPFKMVELTGESMQVGLMRVNNTATEEDIANGDTYKPVGIGLGAPNTQQHAYFENYVILTAKVAPSGTTVSGFMVRVNALVPDDSLPLNTPIYQYNDDGTPMLDADGNHKFVIQTEPVMITKQVQATIFADRTASLGATGDHSFEITYNRYIDASKAQKMGRMQYNASEIRMDADGKTVLATPGYVPSDCRNGIAIEATLPDGSVTTAVGYLNSAYSYNMEDPEGYEYIGMSLDGSDELVTEIPAEMLTADSEISVEFRYKRLLPEILGYQISEVEDGSYTLRLLGMTNHIKCQSLGFKVEMSWTAADGTAMTKEFYRECLYVYDSVNVDGINISASELGAEKLFAYHITGIPEDLENIKMTVTPYYIKGYSDQVQRLAEDCAETFYVNDTPVFEEGIYGENQDNVDFVQ